MIFNLINYKQQNDNHGYLVDHIHLDKNTFGKLFLLKQQHMVFYYLFLLIVTVYKFV